MSKYTTGEIAKACGVSVRTVQYYDSRNILVPSALSEGGRRLYSDEDFGRLRIICFLRDAGISIDSIKRLFFEDHPEKVIAVLIDEQTKLLNAEISERREMLGILDNISSSLRVIENFTIESIGDIAYNMKNRKKMRRLRINMLIGGIIMDIIDVVTISVWIATGNFIPFLIGLIPSVVIGIIISACYYRKTSYICPECHAIFKAGLKEAFWARHTPKTRYLRCINCGHKGFCIETYGGDKNA